MMPLLVGPGIKKLKSVVLKLDETIDSPENAILNRNILFRCTPYAVPQEQFDVAQHGPEENLFIGD